MDAFINAVKTNDLVKAKKAFGSIMSERTAALVEARKRELASQVMIEGEESDSEALAALDKEKADKEKNKASKKDIEYDTDEVKKKGVKDPDADAKKGD